MGAHYCNLWKLVSLVDIRFCRSSCHIAQHVFLGGEQNIRRKIERSLGILLDEFRHQRHDKPNDPVCLVLCATVDLHPCLGRVLVVLSRANRTTQEDQRLDGIANTAEISLRKQKCANPSAKSSTTERRRDHGRHGVHQRLAPCGGRCADRSTGKPVCRGCSLIRCSPNAVCLSPLKDSLKDNSVHFTVSSVCFYILYVLNFVLILLA